MLGHLLLTVWSVLQWLELACFVSLTIFCQICRKYPRQVVHITITWILTEDDVNAGKKSLLTKLSKQSKMNLCRIIESKSEKQAYVM